jgi:YgiT-type zinc finger domain-containing protein
MEKCPICGGERKKGHTTYSVDTGFGGIVVRGVPASICSQCGEEWIDPQTAKTLEEIVKSARSKKANLEVLPFQQVGSG